MLHTRCPTVCAQNLHWADAHRRLATVHARELPAASPTCTRCIQKVQCAVAKGRLAIS